MKKMGAISFIGLAVIGKEPYYFFYLPIFFPYLHMKRKGQKIVKHIKNWVILQYLNQIFDFKKVTTYITK